MSGILYGIGTGPGDPELMTLKAVNRLKTVDMIALPISDKTLTQPKVTRLRLEEEYIQKSAAFQIAYENVPEMLEKEVLLLPMPMMKDKERLKRIHDEAADVVADRKSVV